MVFRMIKSRRILLGACIDVRQGFVRGTLGGVRWDELAKAKQGVLVIKENKGWESRMGYKY